MASKKNPYRAVLSARIVIDAEVIAAKIFDDHAQLLAEGYELRSPVIVSMRKDGTISLPLIYSRKVGARTERESLKIDGYAGWFFGKGPDLGA
ncbi:hypothetical protein [Telmatospirillum sp.]|uniref:hypothetical protein n=1 Tax=Telmatospirillum sp. TaxID=2079197 RepID=UPI00283B1D38|nr:hypothetical protein [Telmatospirillum sp.]MDR3437155.1 hypothetical protein [Telmatospirillum sp.]